MRYITMAPRPSRESQSILMQKGTATTVRKLEDIGGHFVSVLNLNLSIDGLPITNLERGSMDNTARVIYECSVCDKAFGDLHSSCAKLVNGRGACKEKGAVV